MSSVKERVFELSSEFLSVLLRIETSFPTKKIL